MKYVSDRGIFSTNCAILTEQKTRATRKVAFGFGQTHRSTAFLNSCIVEKQRENDILMSNKLLFFGHRNLSRNTTQTAVINIFKIRILFYFLEANK